MPETWVQSLGQEDPQRRKWLPTLVFLPGEFHEQGSLVGYCPWGHKELGTTEILMLSNTNDQNINVTFRSQIHFMEITILLSHAIDALFPLSWKASCDVSSVDVHPQHLSCRNVLILP